MFDSNRVGKFTFGILIAGLLALVLTYLGLRETNRLQRANDAAVDYRAQEYAERAQIEVRRKCRGIEPVAVPQCRYEITEPYREAERGERGLQAQQTMAIWTRMMGMAGVIGMGVGLFGLFLIFTTFRETRRAARAGLQANKIAERNFTAQTRAYVNVDSIYIQEFLPNVAPRLVIKYTNRGQTPAYNFIVKLSASICSTPQSGKVPETHCVTFSRDQNETTIALGPGQIQHKIDQLAVIDTATYNAMMAGTLSYIVNGYVTYTDITGRLRRIVHTHYLPTQKIYAEGNLSLTTARKGNNSN